MASPPPSHPRPQPSILSILSRNTDVTETETIGSPNSPNFQDLEFPKDLRPREKPSQLSITSQNTMVAPVLNEKPTSGPDSEPWKSLSVAEEGELQGLKVEGDVLIVDWNGPKDPENPRNWSSKQLWLLTFICSALSFGSPLASSMTAPGTEQLLKEFSVESRVVGSMMTTIFVLSFAVGPMVLGPLSEVYGRVAVLQTSTTFFIIWNLICGFAQSSTQLIIFRFLAGLGASSPLTVVGGALGDMFPPEKRGKALAIYALMPSIGPVAGPIAASWIAQETTWRWIFWSSTIFEAIILIGFFFIAKETYHPVLLERKAERIRAILKARSATQALPSDIIGLYAGVPIRKIKTIFGENSRSLKDVLSKALTRPFLIFALEPIIQVLGVYIAFIYGILYMALTTIPFIFKIEYGQRLGISGLHYIAVGIGLTGASYLNAQILNPSYVYLKNKYGGEGRPEFRLPSIVPGSLFLPLGLLLVGWAAEKHLHWAIVDLGLLFLGAGIVLCFTSIQMYVVDAFSLHSASALSCLSFLRSLLGFGLPLASVPMYSDLGQGVGNTVLACVAIGIGCPAPFLFWIYGERLRKASRFARK